MNPKRLSFVLVSLLALQSHAATPLVPLWRASVGHTLERCIAQDLSLQVRNQLKTLVPTPAANLSFHLFYPNETQVTALKQQYAASILAAQKLTHELFPTVFYADVLSPHQINQNLMDITHVNGMLTQIDVFLNGEDLPLLNAKENMKNLARYFSSVGSGQAVNWEQFEKDPLSQREWRTFNEKEFFLKDPEGVSRSALSSALPRELKVAVLNDDESILKGLLRMKNMKEAALWTMDGFLSPEELLSRTDIRSYDLVLTDLNIRPGGGEYLSLRLRQMGYQNPILAISAFDEEPFLAQRLYYHEIDGMYAAGAMAAMRVPRIHAVVLDKIKNYYFYRDKYNWKR